MKFVFTAAALAALIVGYGCAVTPPPTVLGGPPLPLPETEVGQVRIDRIFAQGRPVVVDRFAEARGQERGDPTYPAWRPDAMADLEFRGALESEVGQELDRCATGGRALEARILIDEIAYDDRLTSLGDARGFDAMGGVVELTDPAQGNAVVARYDVRIATNSGGLLTRILSDRFDAMAEEFGRALCLQAFGRNPRGPAIRNSTRG